MTNESSIIVESVSNDVRRSFGLVIMVSLITDLKLSGYSAAISAFATFAERDASASGASLTIVLALWRSLTNALWQFLLET